jgi:hypothetical protein
MNTIEDRLRAAAQAAAGTVADSSARALVLPQQERRLTWPARGGGRQPWIVPLVAAAAVIALIAASIFAAHAVVPGSRRPAPGPPSAPLPHLADGLPAYFVEAPISFLGPEPPTENDHYPPIPSRFRSHETLRVVGVTETLRVAATATGKVAATATMPGYIVAVAASRGAFFAAVVRDNLARFYEIRLTASHARTTVSELPIAPDTAPVAYLAASPDGAKLAYSTLVMHGASGGVQNLVVASTTDGSEREWTAPARYSTGSMGPMNWLADGRTLAFNWTGSEKSGYSSLRLLDTAAPGSGLMAGRAVLPYRNEADLFGEYPTLSPNGQVVVGVANGSAAGHAPAGSVVAFSTATARPAVLFRASPAGDQESGCYSPPVWISNAGSEVLVACFQEVKATPPITYLANMLLIEHGRATWLPWLDATAETATAFP